MKIPFFSQYLDRINTQRTIELEQKQQKLAAERNRLKKLEHQQQWREVITSHLAKDNSDLSLYCCPPGNIPSDIEFPATLKSLT